jgi:hypothetical protein
MMFTPLAISLSIWLLYYPAIVLLIAGYVLWSQRDRLNDSQPLLWLTLVFALGTATTLLNNPTWSGFWGMSWFALAVAAALFATQSPYLESGLLVLTVWVVGESALRLVGKLAGVDWLWMTPDKYAWRLVLLSGDWGNWTGMLTVAAPVALQRVRGKWRWGLAMALTVILFFSGSRGAWLAALVAALVALAMARGRGWQLLVVNVALFGLLFLAAGDLLFADRGGVQAGMVQSTGRVTFAGVAIDGIVQHPIAGNGAGSFSMEDYGLDGIYHPHNMLLSWLYDYGVLGVAALCGWLWSLRGGLRREHAPALVAMGVWGLFMSPIMSIQVLFFWYLGGMYHATR